MEKTRDSQVPVPKPMTDAQVRVAMSVLAWIDEELREFREALDRRDLDGVCDAMLDMSGAAVTGCIAFGREQFRRAVEAFDSSQADRGRPRILWSHMIQNGKVLASHSDAASAIGVIQSKADKSGWIKPVSEEV